MKNSKVYVTGHRNPDTDSIVSAMAYAALRNALGDREFTPARLGELNDETTRVLARFGFAPPERLYNVRTQVQDLDFDTPPVISPAVTMHHAWTLMMENKGVSALPVVEEDGRLFGMLAPSDVAGYDMRSISDSCVEGIPLFNLISALEGQLLHDAGGTVDSISGEVMIALPQTQPIAERIARDSILLAGAQPELMRLAIEKGAACVIVCASEVPADLKEAGSTCVISTPYDPYRASRLIFQSIPVGRVCLREEVVFFHQQDYLDDVRETMLQSRFRSYPVLDEEERVVGTVSRFHLIRPRRKRVVLVDHNESAQSIPGLEQAEILEIIDHHRLADVETGAPIYFRNEPVGSTATIIASIFQEKGIMPSKAMAGLLTSAILSDTILFKSPTCTEKDRRMAERMARLAGESLTELGESIFDAPASSNKSAEELLHTDFKEFHIAGHTLGIGQLICMDSAKLMRRAEEFFAALHTSREQKGYDLIMLMLTDVLREGTHLLFLGDRDTIRQAFSVKTDGNDVFLPQVMSRKKQVVPLLSAMWG